MQTQGVIFDFNGTLLWDTPYHSKAFDIFLARYGKHYTEEEKIQKIFGQSNAYIMKGIFGQQLSADEVENYTLEKELIYQDLIKDDLIWAPGAEDLFAYLQAQNIPFAIASSAGAENINFYFRYMPHMEQLFSRERVIYSDGTLPGKPAPDLFERAMQRLGIEPQHIAIFEDSPAGIAAAENAHAKQIFIVNSVEGDYRHYPHPAITNFSQAIPLLQ